MATVKRTDNHDWIRVRVTFAPKVYVQVTWSRYRTSISSSGIEDLALLRNVLAFADDSVRLATEAGVTVGDAIRDFAISAERATSPDTLMAALTHTEG